MSELEYDSERTRNTRNADVLAEYVKLSYAPKEPLYKDAECDRRAVQH